MSIKVSLAQIKPYLGNIDKNKDLIISYIEKAIEEGSDLVVFPELALTGYSVKDMVPSVAGVPQEFYELSKKISILFGGVEESEKYYFYNTAFYLEDGKLLHKHRKVYLPTYGMFDEHRYFAEGDRFRAFDTKFGRFGILICEDAWHSSGAYILNQDGADYIFILSNSPARGINNGKKLTITESWENISRFYASQLSSYVVFSQRVGYEDGLSFWGGSEVISPMGEIEAKASYFDEELVSVKMKREKIRRARIISPVLKTEKLDLTIRELERIQQEKFK
jgi:predicted amidohydrolase